MIDEFIKAIREKKKVRISFYSEQDQTVLIKKCAPLDYGHRPDAKRKIDKYYLWDYEGEPRAHPLGLKPEQIETIKFLEESFNPSEFVKWNTTRKPWIVKRDWGIYS
ncbi:MAG: hypothetical protein ABR951_07405 [Candidatus Aminicenantales bacterium]|jgi:hypothetical protein